MSQNINLKHLLIQTSTLIKHHERLRELKGETFNIFSILKMERKENETHSAFLAELLSPRGSHLKKSIFLKLFLNTIQANNIDIPTAKVMVEKNIGWRDLEAKQGGRVDIYIYDAKGNSICIENKIHAGDQPAQIERYYNYKPEKNKVIYLNLHGTPPSKESCGELVAGEHFHIIAYKTEIIDWLTACMKESFDVPILRESIRQYILLIKKLTSTMDDQFNKDLLSVILHHYDESKYIAENFEAAKNAVREEIRNEVYNRLKDLLGTKYIVELGNRITDNYSQIWIIPLNDDRLFFGLETFSGRPGNFENQLFVGVYNGDADNKIPSGFAAIEGNSNYSLWWPDTYLIPDFQNLPMNLTNGALLSRLASDSKFKNDLIEYVVATVVNYVTRQQVAIDKFLTNSTINASIANV